MAPSGRMLVEEFGARFHQLQPTLQQGEAEEPIATGAQPSSLTPRGQRKWLARFRQNWRLCLGRLKVMPEISAEEIDAKAGQHSLA